MREDSKTAWKIKEQMVKFSERLCEGLKKPQKKFVQQMIYGIQASRDVKVSEVSRSLKEDIALIKTETRLSRNLQHEDMDEILTLEILEMYLTRWKVEESFRFLKQAYRLEDIRVRCWQSLKNMMALVLCVFYFVSVAIPFSRLLKFWGNS